MTDQTVLVKVNSDNDIEDWALASLVMIVERSNAGIIMTLTLNGLVISGTTVSGESFLRALNDVIGGAVEKQLNETGKQSAEFSDFSALADEFYGHHPKDELTDPEKLDRAIALRYSYMHLKDVTIVSSQNIRTSSETELARIPILRVRIDRIDAWFAGNI